MRLPEQQLFPMPVVLDTDREDITEGTFVPLTYVSENTGEERTVAVLEVTSVWKPDKAVEALKVFGTTALDHPGVETLASRKGKFNVGGRVHGIELPEREIPMPTPREVRADLPEETPVIAFQCRNPIHRAHYELLARASSQLQKEEGIEEKAAVLVHPTCGPTQDDDIDPFVRYHTYLALKDEIAEREESGSFIWAMLPYSMHMAGPREAIMHMIIRKNFGATHFVIGRDMAGCKSTITGEDFYGAFDAQEIGRKYASELNVGVVPFEMMVYAEGHGYMTVAEAEGKNLDVKKLSGTAFRKKLRGGEDIPEWFAFKSVVDVLRKMTPPQEQNQ
jgi:sulfate adenylyltransferase